MSIVFYYVNIIFTENVVKNLNIKSFFGTRFLEFELFSLEVWLYRLYSNCLILLKNLTETSRKMSKSGS